MILWIYQQCKYKIENIKIDCIFVFLVSAKTLSETRFNQNCSLVLNWSVTRNRHLRSNHGVWIKTQKNNSEHGSNYTISLSRHEQVCLIRLCFEGRSISKHSLIKHTCLWHDKLIVLWTLNRQAKIFLRMGAIAPSKNVF